MLYRFAEFEFDSEALELRRDGVRIDVQPSVLDLLELLILNADRVVTKEELVEALWGGRAVSDDAIAKRLSQLRKALGDGKRDKQLIRSVYGKGMRFVGTLEGAAPAQSPAVVAEAGDAAVSAGGSDRAQLPDSQAEVPAIAILPFGRTGPEGPFPVMAQGISDDITNALAKLHHLRVIARASAFYYSMLDNPISTIREDLGVRYLLSGSLELVGNRLAIFVELIRTDRESVIWSQRFDGDLGEIHEMRKAMVGPIVHSIEQEVIRLEAARASLLMPSDLSAWSAFHLGQNAGLERLTQDFPAAMRYFDKAIEIAPGFARAHAARSVIHYYLMARGQDSELNHKRMWEESREAIRLDSSDPLAVLTYGLASATVGDWDTGLAFLDRSVALAPNYARAHACRAGVLLATGDLDEALFALIEAELLSPRDPFLPQWDGLRTEMHLLRGDREAMLAAAHNVARRATTHLVPMCWALVGFSQGGDRQAAEAIAPRISKLMEGLTPEDVAGIYRSTNPELSGLLERTLREFRLVT